jgi:hypothetical protein
VITGSRLPGQTAFRPRRLSPVEPDDLRAQSIPMGYLLLTVDSIDGRPHDVQIYMDISGAPPRRRT